MTIEDIQKHPYYKNLSEQQKTYVTARCEGLEPLKASYKAWNVTKDESAIAKANTANRNPNIAWLLAKFFGHAEVPTREQIAESVWRKIQKSDDETAVKFYTILVKILGYEYKAAEITPPKPTDDTNDEFVI